MKVHSNAVTQEDKSLAAAYAEHATGVDEVTLTFEKRHVTVASGEESKRFTRAKFVKLMDDAPAAIPQAKVSAKTAAAPADDPIDRLAAEAFDIGMQERSGEHGKNAARFKRGELMIRLHGAAQGGKLQMKQALEQLNGRMMGLAGENMVPDFTPISEGEASGTRKVVEAFGSSGEFSLVDAVNEFTGDPMVNDAGEPPQMNLTDVAMNKLQPLVEFADSVDQDRLLSFAHRNTEKVVKKAKAVAKNTSTPFSRIITKLNKVYDQKAHPITGKTIRVPAAEKNVLAFLADLNGEAPAPEVASIKTDKAWFDTFWTPLKALYTAVANEFLPGMAPEGQSVSNVFVLERTIGQYFNVHTAEGISMALQALEDAEDISAEQVQQFLSSYAFDSDSGTWASTVTDEAAADTSLEDAVDADEFDEDDAFDDEDDIFGDE